MRKKFIMKLFKIIIYLFFIFMISSCNHSETKNDEIIDAHEHETNNDKSNINTKQVKLYIEEDELNEETPILKQNYSNDSEILRIFKKQIVDYLNAFYDESVKKISYSSDIISNELILSKIRIYNSNSRDEIVKIKNNCIEEIKSLILNNSEIENIYNIYLKNNTWILDYYPKEVYSKNGIITYYGQYNGYYVLNMNGQELLSLTSYPNTMDYRVGKYNFNGISYTFTLIKNDEYKNDLKDAYKNKKISEEDVKKLYYRYRATKYYTEFDKNQMRIQFDIKSFVESFNERKIKSQYNENYINYTPYNSFDYSVKYTNINIKLLLEDDSTILLNELKELFNYDEENKIIKFHDMIDYKYYKDKLIDLLDSSNVIKEANLVFPNLLKS